MWDPNRPARSVARLAAMAYVIGFLAWRVLSSGPPLNAEPGPDSPGQEDAAVHPVLPGPSAHSRRQDAVTFSAETSREPSAAADRATALPDATAPRTAWDRPHSGSAD